MESRLITLFLIASMFVMSYPAQAQDGDFKLFRSLGVGALGSSQNSRDAAKLNEYRDLSDGPFGTFDLRSRGKRLYFDGYGENLGRDDTFFFLSGGGYNNFSFSLYGNWLTHNFGFGPNGARTPFENPGSANLTLISTEPAFLSNVSTPPWSSFKYAVDRRDIGGSFEFSHGSPWYFLVETNEVNQTGINKADAAALGTSPGNGFVDLPYPVDYTTHNVFFEGGYQTPRGHISVNLFDGDFGNDNTLMFFQNPFFGFGRDTVTFAPDNDYVRLSINGMLRHLFWNSTASARLTYDRGTDSYNMITAVLNTSGSDELSPTNPTSPNFNGKVENMTAHASFASLPARHLDTRVYYHFYKRNNSSNDIEFQVLTPGLACFEEGTTSPANVNVFCTGSRYGYTKHNPGIEAGYRINSGNRLSAGNDYFHTRRNRFDADETRENKTFVQWSNTSHETFTARVRYQFIYRRSDFLTDQAGFDANSPFFLERFNRSFDVANLNQHLVKFYFDWTPIPFLDFGFEAYYKRNNYKDLILGRLNDRRKEIYGSVSYGDPTKFRVTLFGDIEFINYDSFHRTINAGTCPETAPNCFDPRTPATTTAFNWAAQLTDKNWTVQLGADWPVNPKLLLKAAALIQQTKGSVDFQSETLASGAPAALLFPISAYDNTQHWSIWPHAVYLVSKNFELTIGYAFEKYAYSDDQFNGYQYTIGTGTTRSYLSGIYAFPDYELHLGYATLRYLF